MDHRNMNKLNFIIVSTLVGTVYTLQIGLIANHLFTYDHPEK